LVVYVCYASGDSSSPTEVRGVLSQLKTRSSFTSLNQLLRRSSNTHHNICRPWRPCFLI